ncbi:hypothetical protein [Endozoicomonas atrinae]|uniref:hypothetical protein n=1 Tax=Endozoicomonas atrinae TaxID=1333660 RepID=UPI003B00FE65
MPVNSVCVSDNNASAETYFNPALTSGAAVTGQAVWQSHQICQVAYPNQLVNQVPGFWQQQTPTSHMVLSAPYMTTVNPGTLFLKPVPIYDLSNTFHPQPQQINYSNYRPYHETVSGASAYVDDWGLVHFVQDPKPQEPLPQPSEEPSSTSQDLTTLLPEDSLAIEYAEYAYEQAMWEPDPENQGAVAPSSMPPISPEIFSLQVRPSTAAEDRKLDQDIKPLFLNCRPAVDQAMSSLTKCMEDCPFFNEIIEGCNVLVKRLKENRKKVGLMHPEERTLASTITPEIYMRKILLPELNSRKSFHEIPAGSLPPFFMPTQNMRAKVGQQRASIDYFRKSYGMSTEEMFDGETRINEHFLHAFTLLSQAFNRKIRCFLEPGQTSPCRTVTDTDLSLHIKVTSLLLFKSLYAFQAGYFKKPEKTTSSFLTIIDHFMHTAHVIHTRLLNTPPLAENQQTFLEKLYLECTRNLIALFSNNSMEIAQRVTKYSRPLAPGEELNIDENFRQHLKTQLLIQDHILKVLNLTQNNPEHHPIYMELIQLSSRSGLFSPAFQDIINGLSQQEDLEQVNTDLPNQTIEFIRHVAEVISGIKRLITTNMTPLKQQQFLNCVKDVWFPLFLCNMPKVFGWQFSVKSQTASLRKISIEYQALLERRKQPDYEHSPLDLFVEGISTLSDLINKLHLTPTKLELELNKEIEALAEKIGTQKQRQAKNKQPSSQNPPPSSPPDESTSNNSNNDETQAIPTGEATSLPLATQPEPTETTCIQELLVEIKPGMTKKAVKKLLDPRLKKLPPHSTERFTLCAETAHRILFVNRHALAEVRIAIPKVDSIYRKVQAATDKVPNSTPDLHTAHVWLNQHFPDNDLESGRLVPLLKKVDKERVDQVKNSINAAYDLLRHCLEEALPPSSSSLSMEEDAAMMNHTEFLLDMSLDTLDKTTEAKTSVAAEIRVNELLKLRKDMMLKLGFGRPGSHHESPLKSLAQEFERQTDYFNKHNQAPGQFCNVNSSELKNSLVRSVKLWGMTQS